jgi:hypothetical protein
LSAKFTVGPLRTQLARLGDGRICQKQDLIRLLGGHISTEVTQAYIDGDSDAQRRLIALL